MELKWVKTPMCKVDNTILLVPGVIINIWSVGPLKDDTRNIYTAGAWSIRSLKTGISVVRYTELKVALNFAQWLWRNYGDITQSCINQYHNAETEYDKHIFDAIDEKAKHPTRVKKKDRVPYIPFNPSDYQSMPS